MREGWKEVILEDLGFVGRGKSRHRPRNANFLYGNKYPFVQTADVKAANYRILEFSQMYSEKGLEQSKLWPVGTLCVTIAANIADAAILGIEACFPDSVIGFIPDKNKSDVRFVKYSFDLLQARIKKISQGAAQDNLSLAKLRTINFLVPPLPTQRKIATILSAYDDLIENNLKRIKLLEEKAQLTYEEWFVRMKFPGYEEAVVDEETGLPEGWDKFKLNKVLKASNGKSFKGDYIEENCLPVYGSNGVIGQSTIHNNEEAIIIGRVGAYCGSIKYCKGKFWATDNTITVTSIDDRIPNLLAYYILKSYDLNKMAGGAAQPLLTQRLINNLVVVTPSEKISQQFKQLTKTIFDTTLSLQNQNQLLKEARDLLLPRLMMGMIDVDEIKTKKINNANI